ncbi:hypothetical protein [Ruegeria atlantica]|uniref:hypothetical protein n=1 Tax=Ruegeria atlantica TaxID=81569 RepID=UPI00071E3116|nr:hypothetical protein [Ruegeria atlantica]
MLRLAAEQVKLSTPYPLGASGRSVRRIDPELQYPLKPERFKRHLFRAKVHGRQGRRFAFGSAPIQL